MTGLAEIARAGYPDAFAWKKGHRYFDASSTKDRPIWYMVDVGFAERFPVIVPLETLKSTKGLEEMVVAKKGSRLSVQPVTAAQWRKILKLGGLS